MEYSIKVEHGKTVMYVTGDIKTSEASQFQSKLLSTLAEHSELVLDLHEVAYVCSAGLRALLAGQQYIDSRDTGELILRNLTPEVDSVIKATGFNNVLTIA